jgi:hypothetical protein
MARERRLASGSLVSGRVLLALGLALALLATACGSDDNAGQESTVRDSATATPVPTTPVTPEPTTPVTPTPADAPRVNSRDLPLPQAMPDGSANVRPPATSFSEVQVVDLTWEEVVTDFEWLGRPQVVDGTLLVRTPDDNWVASADGRNWVTVLAWDRPSELVIRDGVWALLTHDPDKPLVTGDQPIPWIVLLSDGPGQPWRQIPLDLQIVHPPNVSTSYIGGSIGLLDDVVVVSLVRHVYPDWTAIAQEAGLAGPNELVIALGNESPNPELRIIGADRDEVLTVTAADLGLDQDLIDLAALLVPQESSGFASIAGAAFERLGGDAAGIRQIESFGERLRAFTFGGDLVSSNGIDWEPLEDTGSVMVRSAVGDWLVGLTDGPGRTMVVQSLDGGASFDPIEGPAGATFPSFLAALNETGAGLSYIGNESGGPPDGPVVAVSDGFTFSYTFADDELTVTDPDGSVIADGSSANWDNTMAGEFVVLDLDAPAVVASITLDELFAGTGGVVAGRIWAAWSYDGAVWFHDELDFGTDEISPYPVQVYPLGDVVVAFNSLGSGSVHVADGAG